jgi:hypothetical protein
MVAMFCHVLRRIAARGLVCRWRGDMEFILAVNGQKSGFVTANKSCMLCCDVPRLSFGSVSPGRREASIATASGARRRLQKRNDDVSTPKLVTLSEAIQPSSRSQTSINLVDSMHVSIFLWALLANATIGFLNRALVGIDAAVMSGSFNRSVFEAPHEGYASDPSVQQAYDAFPNAHTPRIPSCTTIRLHNC